MSTPDCTVCIVHIFVMLRHFYYDIRCLAYITFVFRLDFLLCMFLNCKLLFHGTRSDCVIFCFPKYLLTNSDIHPLRLEGMMLIYEYLRFDEIICSSVLSA
jgi:hypothetical protein